MKQFLLALMAWTTAVVAGEPVKVDALPLFADGVRAYPTPFLAVARTPGNLPRITTINIQTKFGYLAGFNGFVDMKTHRIGFPCVGGNAALAIAYGADAIVFIPDMPQPWGRQLRQDVTKADGNLATDDVFELLVEPRDRQGRPRGPVYRFVGNAAGILRTEKDLPQVGQFHLDWKAKDIVYAAMQWDPSHIWRGAVSVPFEALGGPPEDGDTWGVQCAFRYADPVIIGTLSSTDKLDDRARFARVRFDDKRQANYLCTRLAGMNEYDFFIGGEGTNSGTTEASMRVSVNLFKSDKPIGAKSGTNAIGPNMMWGAKGDGNFNVRAFPAAPEERDTFGRVVVCEMPAETVVYDQFIPYWRPAKDEDRWLKEYFATRFVFQTGVYPSRNSFDWSVDVRTLAEVKPAATLRLTVSRDGTELRRWNLPIENKGQMAGTLQITDQTTRMPAGKYVFRAEVLDAAQKVLATQASEFVRAIMAFEEAEKAGMQDIVVRPFTEPTQAGTSLTCWGRTCTLGAEGLLTSLLAGGKEVLASPAVLVATTKAGVEIVLKGGAATFSRISKGMFATQQVFSGGSIALSVAGEFDYDGFYRYTATLAAEKTPLDLASLRLEIPLKKEHAFLIDADRQLSVWGNDPAALGVLKGNAGRVWDSKAHPPLDYPNRRHGNMPAYVWLGDDERGLIYSCASMFGMHDDGKALPAAAVDREGERTVLRVWFVNAPITVEKPRTFSFALQATPYKPMPDNFRLWRTQNYPNRYHGQGGRYHAGFARAWVYPTYGRFTDMAKLKKWVDETYRQKGCDFVPVLASSCSECAGTPEYLQFWREWGSDLGFDTMTLSPLPDHMRKPLEEAGVTPNRYVAVEAVSNTCASNLDYRVWWFDQMARKGGIDEVYQDNPTYTWWDQPEAGYGYSGENGQRECESMIWNNRLFQKRIAHSATDAGWPDSPYVWANLISAALPGRSFCRVALCGECPASDKIPLDELRIVLSKQWGIHLQWLFQEPSDGATRQYWRTLCSRLFLLDCTDFSRDSDQAWRWLYALDTFRLDDPTLKWHPYYASDIFDAADKLPTLVSAYTAEKRALLVVSNQGQSDLAATVTPKNLEKFCGGKTVCWYDAETGETIETKGDTLKLFVPALDYRVVFGFTTPFGYSAAKHFPDREIPAQSALDARAALTHACEQLLKKPTFDVDPQFHLLTQLWLAQGVKALTDDQNQMVYLDETAAGKVDIGASALRRAVIYNKKRNVVMLVYLNPTREWVRLPGDVRNLLAKAVPCRGTYVLDPISGESDYRTLSVPPQGGRVEVLYEDSGDFWKARRGPFPCGTQQSNMREAAEAKAAERSPRAP
ncbi:MAG TPA: glycoside hydrolase domain-containing protein [Planctomycetota bacterium]|jgi:hypothetical protein